MRAVSDRFLNSLRGSHKMRARATVLTTYQEGTTPTGTEIPILDGNVVLSSSNDIRATLELTTDGTAWDYVTTGLLTPYGNEIYVERGIEFGDGSTEWVGLGYFRIYSVEQPQVPDGPIRISGRDRMSKIIDARLETPRPMSSGGVEVVDIIFDILIYDESYIDVLYPDSIATFAEFEDVNFEIDSVKATVAEQDRYGYLKDLCRAGGQIMYFDHRGILQVKPVPSDTTPVWEVNAGENGVLVTMSRNLNREGLYNVVIATGEATDTTAPARGAARDVNPYSPTNYYGDFGPVPTFYSSPQLTSNTKARTAAAAVLRQGLGRPASIDFSAIPNPALEPWDPVSVDFGPRTEVHIIDELTIPLVAEQPLTGKTRTSIGEEFEVS